MKLIAALALCSTVAAQEAKAPRVEVVFVLDTTGSMGGLLDGAKKKIWSIANQIAGGKPTPDLRIGLVGYRDKGDEYVTRVFDLTDDLDAMYANLTAFQPNGGGDAPENVRQAMHEAVTKIGWSKEPGAIKIIFLVGDAPPHLDYTDVPTVEEICKRAIAGDIIVNAIRCGGDAETGRIWQEIARGAEGEFFSIDQSGGVVAIATPFDKELGELSDKVGKTVLAFGDAKLRREVERKEAAAEAAPAPAKADRVAAKGAIGRLYADDLVDAVREKRVKLEEVKDADLPEEMKKMTADERKAFVEQRGRERAELNAKVKELSQKREAHIAAELKKLGKEDAFDQVVRKALAKQLRKGGVDLGGEK
jgi:hypothetical protein